MRIEDLKKFFFIEMLIKIVFVHGIFMWCWKELFLSNSKYTDTMQIRYCSTLALVECHKIVCLTIQIMHFGSKTNAPKDGLKIRVVALAPGPSLWTAFRAANRRSRWNLRDQNSPRGTCNFWSNEARKDHDPSKQRKLPQDFKFLT